MSKNRIFCAFLFCSLLIIFSFAFATSPVETEHFRIMGFGGEIQEANLKKIGRDLETAYHDIATFLALDPYRFSRIEVNVYLKPQGGRGIRASAGYESISLDADFNDMELLRHELTHILINKAMPSAPRWFHEGVAQYISGGDIRQAKVNPRLTVKDFSFVRLEADFGADRTEEEAYYYAWSVVSYLIDKYGKEKLQVLFKESGFFSDKFEKAYGIELNMVEEKAVEIFGKYKPKDK